MRFHFRYGAFGFPTCVLLITSLVGIAPAFAAQAQETSANSLEHSIQTLAEQVKQLNVTIMELRSEVSRSRQETSDVREELRQALEKLASGNSGGQPKGEKPATIADAPTPATLPLYPPDRIELSAAERLTQIEEDHRLLSDKIDEQYQTKVESASKYRMKLSGMVLFNMFGNRGRVDNQDVPNLAQKRGPLDTGGDFGATLRQSQLGFEVYGPTFSGARASADLRLDFFGGFPDTASGTTAGLVRLRTATMRLDWLRTSIVVGQDAPFFSPQSPTSIASLGYPAFSYSGNLWTWLPQVRVEHRLNLSEAHSISVQGGLVDPLIGDYPYSQSYRTPQAGEKSWQPAYASRLAWMHGDSDRPLILAIGGYYSRQNYGAGRTVDAWASTSDWNVPFGSRLALSGEFYRGRALGGLGASHDRSVVFSGPQTDPSSSLEGLDSIGGWTQLKFKATEAVEFNAAYGEDNPFARDLRYFLPFTGQYLPPRKNKNDLFNVIYRPRTDLLFSLEYRRLNTLKISNERYRASHLNLGIGVLF